MYLLKAIWRILPVLLIVLSGSVGAQTTGWLAGTVTEKGTNDQLIGANIKLISDPSVGTAANIHGEYLLELPQGRQRLVCSFTGMQPDTFSVVIIPGDTILKDIKMKLFTSQLTGVEVRAGRFEKPLEEMTVSMEVINPAQIENRSSSHIEKILDYTPGITILDGEPQIRGGSGFTFGVGSKVGVFIDDRPALSGDANRPYWTLIPVDAIAQVEIVKGASSVLSGSSALSGAIYLRTKRPGLEPRTTLKIHSGWYGRPRYSYMKWWEQAPLFTGLDWHHSRMTSRQTDLTIGGHLYYDHGYEGPPVTLPGIVDTVSDFTENQMKERSGGLHFNLYHRNKKITGLRYGIAGNFVREHTKLMIAWLDDSAGFYRTYPGAVSLQDRTIGYLDPEIEFHSGVGFSHKLQARFLYNDNRMTNNQSNRSSIVYTDYHFQREYPHLNNFRFTGGFSTQSTFSEAEMYGASGSSINRLFNFSGYAQAEYALFKTINLVAGFRYEYFQLNGSKFDTKPIFRTGLSLKLMEETYLRMSLGQGYRYPTIAERFIRINMGTFGVFENPDLVPETSVNAEVGVKQGFKLANFLGYLDVALFQQDYNNTIEYLFGFWDSTYTFAIGGFKFLNTGRSRIIGADISVNGKALLTPKTRLLLMAGYNYIQPRSLEPDYIFAYDYNPSGHTAFTFNNTSVNPENNILKYRFLHTAKADIGVETNGISAGILMKYFSKIVNLDKAIEDFERATEAAGGSMQPIQYMDYFYNENKGRLIIDLRAGYEWKDRHKITFTVKNLTNQRYSLRPLKAEPMRSFVVYYTLKI
ncbi:MAG: hypothetical protein Kow00127_21860 [Bacteroidales bacterium]